MKRESGASALAERDVVTPDSAVAEPWANGLGVTRVLQKRLAWRLSVAEIRGSGRFSRLPGRDRCLMLTGDQPLGLMIDGRHLRIEPGESVQFTGESRVMPSPTALGATVVNLMTTRTLATSHTRRVVLSGRRVVWPDEAGVTVVLTGDVTLDGVRLPHGSALLPSAQSRTLTGHGVLAVLTISPHPDVPRL